MRERERCMLFGGEQSCALSRPQSLNIFKRAYINSLRNEDDAEGGGFFFLRVKTRKQKSFYAASS